MMGDDMRNFLLNISPLTFTTSAVIVGYLLSDDLSVEEQAALGAWFNVVGDILASSAGWLAVLQARNELSSNDDTNDNDDIEMLKKSIEKIQKILAENNHSQDKM